MLGIDRCSVYAGSINKNVLHWDFIQSAVYTVVRFSQGFGLYRFRCIAKLGEQFGFPFINMDEY